jgi:hypothetical protein
MSLKDEEEYKRHLTQSEIEATDDESGESGSGSSGSAIEFHDFLAPGDGLREDLLPDEIRRLLSIHESVNKENVKKQKEKKEQYKNLKEGKQSLDQYRNEQAENGMNADKPAHPILSQAAQFSGIDSQVNPVINENNADTNQANREELELQYRLRNRPENAPRFNPKPTPYSR